MRFTFFYFTCFLVYNKLISAAVVKQVSSGIDAEVIVIGAGPAGIAATTKLDKNNISVKVLEAEPRFGGRIHSIQFGDAYVDLGAEWCHGEENNIVYELMKDSGILQHPNYTYRFYTSDGKITDKELSDQVHTIFEELYLANGDRNSTQEQTVGSYLLNAYNKTIHQRFPEVGNLNFAKLALHTIERYVLSSEGAFSWFEPSALSDFKDCEGDNTLTWNGLGYKTVLDKLMANLNSTNKLLLNKEVKKIVYDKEDDIVKILLTTGETFKSQHVIFTPSLGVLKDKHQEMFEPSLNQNKVRAIETIGIGAVMKVIVHYPDKWWGELESDVASFVWTQDDRDNLTKQFTKGPQKLDRSWLLDFMGVFKVEKNPNVLSCWFTGEFIPEIEKMDEEVLVDGITFALNKFLGHKVQRPDKIARSKWYTNSHFQGTYSFQTISSRKMKPSANEILSEPITNSVGMPKILFAGEATHPYYYSTVHGAIETGIREADRLIKIIKQ